MKLVADGNFPRLVLLLLRQCGFNIVAITEIRPGLGDRELLAIAAAEDRTLLTFDKDFGQLAFRRGMPASCGVILFRTGSLTPPESAHIALATLQSGATWAGRFSGVSDRKIRVTSLPPPPRN